MSPDTDEPEWHATCAHVRELYSAELCDELQRAAMPLCSGEETTYMLHEILTMDPMRDMLVAMPLVVQLLDELLVSKYAARQMRDHPADQTTPRMVKYLDSKTRGLATVSAMVLKSSHSKAIPLLTWAVGVCLHRLGCSRTVLSLLSRMRLVPSPSFLLKKLPALGKLMPPLSDCGYFCTLVADNCEMWVGVKFERGAFCGRMLSFIQHAEVAAWPLGSDPAGTGSDGTVLEEVTVSGTTHQDGAGPWQLVDIGSFEEQLCFSSPVLHRWTRDRYQTYVALMRTGQSPLALHPDHLPPSRTLYHVKDIAIGEPPFRITTHSKADVSRLLALYHKEYIVDRHYRFLVVVGDEQLFSFFWSLLVDEWPLYSWLVPVPAAWHWHWHVLRGIHKLWGSWLFTPLAHLLGHSHAPNPDRHMRDFEHYLHRVLIGVGRWAMTIAHSAPRIRHFTDIARQCEGNPEAVTMLYFFYFVALPYFSFYSSLRGGDLKRFSGAVSYFLPLMLAAHKWYVASTSIPHFHCYHSQLVPSRAMPLIGDMLGSRSCSCGKQGLSLHLHNMQCARPSL